MIGLANGEKRSWNVLRDGRSLQRKGQVFDRNDIEDSV
jgi:hypothetical protein